MTSRTYKWNAFETQLASGISAGESSIELDTAVGLRAPGYLTIAPDDPLKREIIKFTGIQAATITGCQRGLGGSAAGAQAHDAGTVIRDAMHHQVIDDLFDDIEDLESFETNHAGGIDTADHPEATTSTRGFLSAADKTKLDGIEAGAEANPSASELLTSIKTVDGAGSGLDADTLDGQQASAFVTDAEFDHTHDPDYYIQPTVGASGITANGQWQVVHTMTSAPRDGVIIFFAQAMFASSGMTSDDNVELSAGTTPGQFKMRSQLDAPADGAHLTVVGIISVTQGTAINMWARSLADAGYSLFIADRSCGYAYLDGDVTSGQT